MLTSNNLALPLFSLIFLGEISQKFHNLWKLSCWSIKSRKRGYQCSFLAFCNYVFSSSISISSLIDGRCANFGTAFSYFSWTVSVMWTAQSSVIDIVVLNSPDVSDKFKFSLTLLSYVLPSLVSFLDASDCLFNCDLRRLNSTVEFLHLCLLLFLSMLSLNSLQQIPGSVLRHSSVLRMYSWQIFLWDTTGHSKIITLGSRWST